MGSTNLDKLREKREALDARIRREQAKGKAQQRKADTRRKILAGAVVLEQADRDAAFKSELHKLLAERLTRADDRLLFGLPVLVSNTERQADAA